VLDKLVRDAEAKLDEVGGLVEEVNDLLSLDVDGVELPSRGSRG